MFGNYYELTYCVKNSVDPDQLAPSEASWSGSTLFLIIYVWFHTVFKGVYTCILKKQFLQEENKKSGNFMQQT